MAVNDVQMLPPHVLQMEQMRDLLQAEQQLITQLLLKIYHTQENLYLHSSTDTLSRLESIYGLPTNTTMNIEERRRRLIIKHNSRAPCTPSSLEELGRMITGCPCKVTEYPDQGAFDLSVSVPVHGSTVAMAELLYQIGEVRPAHLLYLLLGRITPFSAVNHQHALLSSVRFSLDVYNPGSYYHTFNGIGKWDGRQTFDASPKSGARLYSFHTGFVVIEDELAFSLVAQKICVRFSNPCGFSVPSVAVCVRRYPLLFNGSYVFDGSKRFNQSPIASSKYRCSAVAISTAAKNSNTINITINKGAIT